MTNIIEQTINNIKANTASSLEEAQILNIPSRFYLDITQVDSIPGYHHTNGDIMFLSNNIPYKNIMDIMYRETCMIDINTLGYVSPFIIFINGKVINWNNVYLIKDLHYSYIIIKNFHEEINYLVSVVFPFGIEYIYNKIPEKDPLEMIDIVVEPYTGLGLVFNASGLYDTCGEFIYKFNNSRITMQKFDKNINFKPYENRIFKTNIFVFTDGLYKRYPSIEDIGLNIFIAEKNNITNTITSLVFHYDQYPDDGIMERIIPDNMIKVKNREYLESNIKNNSMPYVVDIKKDLELSSNVSSDVNIKEILDYDSSLLNKIYKENSYIYNITYIGSHIKSLSVDGIFSMGCIDKEYDTSMIMFVNGNLFSLTDKIKYIDGRFNIPTESILSNDVISMVFFKHCDNTAIPLVVPIQGIKLDGFMRNIPNKRILSKIPVAPAHTIVINDVTQYDVLFNISSDNILTVEDSYVGIPVTLISDRQYKYCKTVITDDEAAIGIVLPDDFKYCRDTNRYIVFINGKKISRNNFVLTIPKNTRPFEKIMIYTNILLYTDDTIEVFYTPEVFTEITSYGNVDIDGDLIIPRDAISYPLDSDMYMLFVNGVKINNEFITSIDSNRIKVITDIKSIKNYSIVQYMSNSFSDVFKTSSSIWDNIMGSISDDEINALMNITPITITDIQEDINTNMVPMKSVIYEVIKQNWLKDPNKVNQIQSYDFDEADFMKDIDGNVVPGLLNSNLVDKLAKYYRGGRLLVDSTTTEVVRLDNQTTDKMIWKW